MSYPTFEHLYPNALRKHDANKPGIQPSAHVREGVQPTPAASPTTGWRRWIPLRASEKGETS